jgi:hypothetical protein
MKLPGAAVWQSPLDAVVDFSKGKWLNGERVHAR